MNKKMLANLLEVKGILGINSTANDAQLSAILTAMNEVVLDYLGWDPESGSKTYTTRTCDIINCAVYTPFYNITTLDEVNGQAYAGVLGTDYYIHKNKIIISDLQTYLSNLNFEYFEIVVTAGYAIVPQAIKQALATLVGGVFAKENGASIQEYKLGPRTIKYGKVEGDDGLDNMSSIESLLKPYRALVFKKGCSSTNLARSILIR